MTGKNDNSLRQADTSSYTISSTNTFTQSGTTIDGVTGIDVHPCTGEIFAMLKINNQSGRSLAVIDTNGNATVIGNTGDNVADITFDNQGTLYAVTGDGANTPEVLYTVDLSDGSLTTFMSLGNGNDGEAICFNPDDGMLYHWSGWTNTTGITFEKINLNTQAITSIGMAGGASPVSIFTAAYADNGVFVATGASDSVYTVTTSGVITPIAELSFSCKGLAFEKPDGIGIIGSNDGLCPNDSVVLTSSAGSGYQWYLNGQAISGATGQSYVSYEGGQFNCVVTTTNCTDSSFAGFFLDSFNLPEVSLSAADSGICPGEVVTITGSSGGQSQWFLNGDTVAGETSNLINTSIPGWYNMTKTNSNGCTDSSEVGILIQSFEVPDVNIGNDTAVCDGTELMLDAGSYPGASYIWFGLGTSQTVMVSDSGQYVAWVTSNQDCVGKDTINVSLLALPEIVGLPADGDTLCVENGSLLVDAGSGHASYLWGNGDITQTTEVEPSDWGWPDSTAAWIDVTVTNTDGCSASDSFYLYFEICGGISDNSKPLFEVYPNPSTGLFTIISAEAYDRIEIMDHAGRLIQIIESPQNSRVVEVEKTGMYFMRLSNSSYTAVKRIVVE